MKKRLSALLLLLLLLSGCSRRGTQIKEPVRFYYPLTIYEYDEDASVIDYEEREAAGHLEELPYLLALYLSGPVEEQLSAVFPPETALQHVEQNPQMIIVQLSNNAYSLSDADFTLACSCLSMTLQELTGVPSVTITSGPRARTITQDSLLFLDDYRGPAE